MQNKNDKNLARYDWLSPIILTVVILAFVAVLLAEVGVDPFSSMKAEVVIWGRHTRDLVFPQTGTSTVTLPGEPEDATPSYEAQTLAIGNWTYTLTDVRWSGTSLEVDLTIKNDAAETLPFGFSYQVEDQDFTTVYKLCAVDSLQTTYWDEKMESAGAGFYNREFGPGQSVSGTLKYKVYSDAGNVYLCMAVGGKAGAKLFYLGMPQLAY